MTPEQLGLAPGGGRGGIHDGAERTEQLLWWIVRLTGVLAMWSLWPITYSLQSARPRRAS